MRTIGCTICRVDHGTIPQRTRGEGISGARIVEEAARESVPLSEVERKMLYFSETDWICQTSWKSTTSSVAITTKTNTKRKSRAWSAKLPSDRKESGEQYDAWWDAIRLLEK